MQADQVDVRIKAVKFIGRLFALPGHRLVHEYRQLFTEFMKRFSDKSAEVRLGAISCAKAFYVTYPLGTESVEVLSKSNTVYIFIGWSVLISY